MLMDCETLEEIIEIRDELATAFNAFTLPKKIINAIFTKPSQYITPKLEQMGVVLIENGIASSLDKTPGLTKTVPLLTEMMIDGLAPLNIVQPSAGFTFIEERKHRHPSLFTLHKELAKLEMVHLFEQNTLSFRAKTNRFMPESMLKQMTEVFAEISMGLRRTGYYNQYLDDVLYVLAKLASKESLLTSGIPKSVADSRSVTELRQNYTFNSLAISNAPDILVTAEWDLQKACDTVLEALYLSKRLRIVDLSTSVSHYRYSNIVDGRSNLVGGVLSPHVKPEYNSDVAVFASIDNITNHKTGTKLPSYTDILTGMTEPLNKSNMFAHSHIASTALMSHCHITESDEKSRSTLLCIANLAPDDLAHLAAVKADGVFYHFDRIGDAVTLVYKKELQGLRLKADDLPFADVVYTTDPATLLLSCQPFEEKSAFVYRKKAIDQRSWSCRFLDIDKHTLEFNSDERFVATIENSSLAIQTNLLSLLSLRRRLNAVMLEDHNIRDWMTGAMMAPIVALSLSDNQILDDSLTPSSNPAFIQTSHLLVASLEPIMKTRQFKMIVRGLIRRIAGKADSDMRDLSYQKLHQVHLHKQLQIDVALFILKSIGVINGVRVATDDQTYVDEVLTRFGHSVEGPDAVITSVKIDTVVKSVLKRSHYFAHLIGAELVDMNQSLDDID
jgi:hypothetical protein